MRTSGISMRSSGDSSSAKSFSELKVDFKERRSSSTCSVYGFLFLGAKLEALLEFGKITFKGKEMVSDESDRLFLGHFKAEEVACNRAAFQEESTVRLKSKKYF